MGFFNLEAFATAVQGVTGKRNQSTQNTTPLIRTQTAKATIDLCGDVTMALMEVAVGDRLLTFKQHTSVTNSGIVFRMMRNGAPVTGYPGLGTTALFTKGYKGIPYQEKNAEGEDVTKYEGSTGNLLGDANGNSLSFSGSAPFAELGGNSENIVTYEPIKAYALAFCYSDGNEEGTIELIESPDVTLENEVARLTVNSAKAIDSKLRDEAVSVTAPFVYDAETMQPFVICQFLAETPKAVRTRRTTSDNATLTEEEMNDEDTTALGLEPDEMADLFSADGN